jgi:hypothetical protein
MQAFIFWYRQLQYYDALVVSLNCTLQIYLPAVRQVEQ